MQAGGFSVMSPAMRLFVCSINSLSLIGPSALSERGHQSQHIRCIVLASPPTTLGQAVRNTGHPIDIAHSSLELLSDPPTATSQAAGITGMRHHTRSSINEKEICFKIRFLK
uniref:Uncharacterized protein n=1 Tax=Chelydra serpentina TaxID=8475 RepID=A0A8C3SD63_CHESE